MRYPDAMQLNVYEIDGKFLIPTKAKTEKGWSLIVDPVHMVAVGEVEELVHVMRRVMHEERKIVPHPDDASLRRGPGPLALAAGCKSWREFLRRSRAWAVNVDGPTATILPSRREGDSILWERRGEQIVSLAQGLEVLARKLIALAREGP
jgi:trehalose utilization protein